MEKIQLNPQLTQEDIQTAISRYHYQDTDLPLFFQVYEEVRKYLDPEGYYVYSGPDRERIGNRIWKAAGEKAKKETQKETQKETKKEKTIPKKVSNDTEPMEESSHGRW